MSDSLLTEAGYCDPWRVGLQGPAPASSPWTRPLSTTLKLHTFPGSVMYFIIMKNVHWDNQQVNKSSHLLYLPSLLGLFVSVVWDYRYESTHSMSLGPVSQQHWSVQFREQQVREPAVPLSTVWSNTKPLFLRFRSHLFFRKWGCNFGFPHIIA